MAIKVDMPTFKDFSLEKKVKTLHSDIVNDYQVDFYGRRLASCSSDKTINIYDISSEDCSLLTTLIGHEGPVWRVAWSDPAFGCYLASCSYDKKVIIWKESLSQWKKDYVHVTHLSSVTSIDWAPYEHGLSLACASYDGSVSIITLNKDEKWDYTIISEVDKVGVLSICWGPPYTYPSENKPELVKQIATSGVEGVVKIYRFIDNRWRQVEDLCGDQDSAQSVSWTTAEFGSLNLIASCYHNGCVLIWSKNDNKDDQWEPVLLKQFPHPVWHVCWSEVGNILAVSCGENSVSLWKRSLDSTWECISEPTDLSVDQP